MKLDIDTILKYKYIIFNNKNKELLYFIVTNYFNLQIKDISELNQIYKYTIFNKINKEYAINVNKNYNNNLLLSLNPKIILLDSLYLENISSFNSVLMFESIACNIGTVSDFLSKKFNTCISKNYKSTKYSIYQAINENSTEFINSILKLDVNVSSNLSNIKKIKYINRRSKYLSLVI